jgi:shikimate dehydrogenase
MKRKISGHTDIYALLGDPVEHSASCAMHNAAFSSLNIDACYITFQVNKNSLKQALASIKALNIKGVNITIPHKQDCIKYLDKVDAHARKIGAVNTILHKNGKLIGYNTDSDGFLLSLKQDANFCPKGKSIFIMGAGGAARAVAYAVAKAKAKYIFIQDIKNSRARSLVAALKQDYKKVKIVKVSVKNKLKTKKSIASADLFVNATGVGLKKSDAPVIDARLLNDRSLVCDLIYNPKTPALIKAAKKRGLKTINGEGLLIYQGIMAFEIWIAKKPDLKIYKRALNNFLKRKK